MSGLPRSVKVDTAPSNLKVAGRSMGFGGWRGMRVEGKGDMGRYRSMIRVTGF